MIGSKDDQLSIKPAAAIYPSRLSPIRPSLLEPSRQVHPSTHSEPNAFSKHSRLSLQCQSSILQASLQQNTITDYHQYLGELMEDCQRSVQLCCYQLQPPQTPQGLRSPYASKEQQTVAPPPFVPLSQSSMVNLATACPSQNNPNPTLPIGNAVPGQQMHYRHMGQRPLKKELKKRGLLCGGLLADIVKRLEKDDKFQASVRTAEDYDTMNSKDMRALCVSRSIPIDGTDTLRRDRLKAHDKRGSAPGDKGGRQMLEEKPSVLTNVIPLGRIIHKACTKCRKSHVSSTLQCNWTKLTHITAALYT